MAKKVVGFVKLQIPGGQATMAPPVGPALGQRGINGMEFCKQFNARTQKDHGTIIPVVITIFSDKSFSFVTKTPPAATLLLKASKLEKGSAQSNRLKVGQVTKKQLSEIASIKMKDLNARTIESACKVIEGTARSMGITVKG